MYDDDVEVTETKLPGIGMRHDFLTENGRRVGVVSHRNGQRDLVVFSKDDPDSCSAVLPMSASEADALAQFLGSGRIVEKLATLSAQISSLATGKVRIAHGSTGAWVVEWMRDREFVASPGPETGLRGGDTLVVVGTPTAIDELKHIIDE